MAEPGVCHFRPSGLLKLASEAFIFMPGAWSGMLGTGIGALVHI